MLACLFLFKVLLLIHFSRFFTHIHAISTFILVPPMRKTCGYGALNRPIRRFLTTRADSRLLAVKNDESEQKRSIVFKIFGKRPPRVTGYVVT